MISPVWILELERGRSYPYEGNYSAWLEQKAKRLLQEAREDKAKQKVLEKELQWIRSGAKARQAKVQGPYFANITKWRANRNANAFLRRRSSSPTANALAAR